MTEQEMLDFALMCIRGEKPLYELGHMIRDARNVRMEEVMFGKNLKHGFEVKLLLKQAEHAAQYKTE
jgi:hypothetical protein